MEEWNKKLKDMKNEKKETIPDAPVTSDDSEDNNVKKEKVTSIAKRKFALIKKFHCMVILLV